MGNWWDWLIGCTWWPRWACISSAPAYRPPTRPRLATPWELRPQIESAAPWTAWQRCPERHRARESKQRWQGEASACR